MGGAKLYSQLGLGRNHISTQFSRFETYKGCLNYCTPKMFNLLHNIVSSSVNINDFLIGFSFFWANCRGFL